MAKPLVTGTRGRVGGNGTTNSWGESPEDLWVSPPAADAVDARRTAFKFLTKRKVSSSETKAAPEGAPPETSQRGVHHT